MIRSIPPRTMSTVSRERRSGRLPGAGSSKRAGVQVTPARKPRQWRYQTRPSFKRVRGPLVDVFAEAEEVLIVVDLGGFSRGEISVTMTREHYLLEALRGGQWFREVIDLPSNVDVERCRERLVNGVLEIVLPRRKIPLGQRTGGRKTGGDP